MCIHLNLMIFTKIIRGFISAKFIHAYLENTNFENCDNKDTADFRNTIKESKKFLSAQITLAKESLSKALKNTDERISENNKESTNLRCCLLYTSIYGW